MAESCVFCSIVAGKIPAKKVYEDDDVVAFHDLNPQAPTHVLVVPKRHVSRVADLTAGDESLAGRWLLAGARVARELGLAENGYRLVANNGDDGGQTVHHLHLHVLGGRRMTWPPG